MKIYVAGHRGLVGSAVVREIENQEVHDWIGRTHDELDLLDRSAVHAFILEENPDAIIVAAAKVGGIGANSKFPVEFLTQNLQLQTNILDAAHAAGTERLVFLGSSCIYPKMSMQPIKEEYLLGGPLEPTNEAYAIAKIAGLKLVSAYRSQYGRKWISLMPTNLYGPLDNFSLEDGHVLPALIRRFHEAKIAHSEFVTLWGTGAPRREFLHAQDLASAIMFLLENYSGDQALNVGTGHDLPIRQLAEIVSNVVGFTGSIEWDSTKPDGTPRKLLDVSKLHQLGWKHKIELQEGIEQTYSWFLANLAPGA